MKTLSLNEKTNIPIIGFGTWQIQGQECVKAVQTALEVGYTHIDTADAYGNHTEVAKGIKNSGKSREELFITTKVFHGDLHKKTVEKKCDQFLKELGTEYIDLLLIHWPNRNIPIGETLEALHNLQEKGKIKAIGVSNFTIHHLEDALAIGVEITNNQVELHPSLNQKELKAFCDSKGLTLTAYSPLGRGEELENPIIKEIAQKYDKPASQVILSWIFSQNIIAIPKSVNPERIADNFKATEWTLDREDIEKINAIPQSDRMVVPGFAEFDY